jgi:hypothetical protein
MQQNTSHFQDVEIWKSQTLELIMSSLYFFMLIAYLKDWIQKKAELGWYLPRKKQSYVNRLSLLQDPNLINKQLEDLPGQYYLLKEYFRVIIILQKRAAGIQLSFPKKSNHYNPEILLM